MPAQSRCSIPQAIIASARAIGHHAISSSERWLAAFSPSLQRGAAATQRLHWATDHGDPRYQVFPQCVVPIGCCPRGGRPAFPANIAAVPSRNRSAIDRRCRLSRLQRNFASDSAPRQRSPAASLSDPGLCYRIGNRTRTASAIAAEFASIEKICI